MIMWWWNCVLETVCNDLNWMCNVCNDLNWMCNAVWTCPKKKHVTRYSGHHFSRLGCFRPTHDQTNNISYCMREGDTKCKYFMMLVPLSKLKADSLVCQVHFTNGKAGFSQTELLTHLIIRIIPTWKRLKLSGRLCWCQTLCFNTNWCLQCTKGVDYLLIAKPVFK